jgi:hypothetical protein
MSDKGYMQRANLKEVRGLKMDRIERLFGSPSLGVILHK